MGSSTTKPKQINLYSIIPLPKELVGLVREYYRHDEYTRVMLDIPRVMLCFCDFDQRVRPRFYVGKCRFCGADHPQGMSMLNRNARAMVVPCMGLFTREEDTKRFMAALGGRDDGGDAQYERVTIRDGRRVQLEYVPDVP